jgi:hypothetical protein
MTKSRMTSNCTSVAAHFEGCVDALVQCKAHCPMQYVQGYTGSHLTLPSGDYSLCISPAAARATANKIATKTYTYFAGRFDGHGKAPVKYHAHRLMEEVQGFTRNNWTPPLGK